MELVSNSPITVTDDDREMARDALVLGWNACPRSSGNWREPNCTCDLGAISGCKERVEKIAYAIAFARQCPDEDEEDGDGPFTTDELE